MGGDGGAVAKRSELVKAATQNTGSEFGTVCFLSGRPLEDPVMSDWRGRVYNKEAVLECLLGERPKQPEDTFSSIRDLCELYDRTIIDGAWSCPITRRPVASQRTVYFPECGHVVAQRAFKVVELNTCPICERSTRGPVLLNAQSKDDVDKAAARISALRKEGLTHSLRKRHKANRDESRPKRGREPSIDSPIKRPSH